MKTRTCRSWRVRGWRIVRCSWAPEHVFISKWHCAEETTGHVWLVKDRERPSNKIQSIG